MSARTWLAPLFSGCVTWAVLVWMLKYGRRWLPLDHPNARSLHGEPIPRTGGVAIMIGVLPTLIWPQSEFTSPALAAGGLCLLSLIDDFNGLPSAVRLIAHLLAALVALSAMLPDAATPFVAILAVAVAWMTNLYNFMDGSDGLAGGMAAIGFAAYASAAMLAGANETTLVFCSLVAAAVAFLLFNFHPARVFMGDSGSVPIGFLVAVLGVGGVREGIWPFWFPLLVFSPFIADATVTLVRRAMRGERIWEAHRSHYYQRLVRSGFGHRGTALREYALMSGCALSALAAIRSPAAIQMALIAAWTLVYFLLARWVDSRWRQLEANERAR